VESSPQNASLLEVDGLSVAFPGLPRPVVDRVSFSLATGETLALVGESGAGKSMTGLAVQRLVPTPGAITAGSINWKGTNLLEFSEVAMRRIRGREIGTVWQEPSSVMNPAIKIGLQISEVVRVHTGVTRREARRRAIELLDHVRIPEARQRFHAYPGELSGGMLQRVVIAAAIACRPDLLIADEATTALDASVQRQVLELIAELQREMGMAILFVTHNLALVAEMGDRVIVMREGRVLESAPVDRLFADPKDPYTRELLEAIPRPLASE
jgi:ABC-type dipeptide/oligopeptide/nickel transport system ATPase component